MPHPSLPAMLQTVPTTLCHTHLDRDSADVASPLSRALPLAPAEKWVLVCKMEFLLIRKEKKETLGYELKGPFQNSETKWRGKPRGWYRGPMNSELSAVEGLSKKRWLQSEKQHINTVNENLLGLGQDKVRKKMQSGIHNMNKSTCFQLYWIQIHLRKKVNFCFEAQP